MLPANTIPLLRITVTRSLGDAAAQRIGVICEPDLKIIPLDDAVKFIVLGTDGLWDGISIEECVATASQNEGNAAKCAADLLSAGLKGLAAKNIDDNLTHVVCSWPML